MALHRTDSIKETLMNKLYVKLRAHGLDKIYIELIEDYPCETLEQLRQQEGYYIRLMGTLNTRIECRTNQEYYYDNIEKTKNTKNK